jgi:hypothetical protein
MQVVTSEMPSMLTSNHKKAGSKPALYSLLGPSRVDLTRLSETLTDDETKNRRSGRGCACLR